MNGLSMLKAGGFLHIFCFEWLFRLMQRWIWRALVSGVNDGYYVPMDSSMDHPSSEASDPDFLAWHWAHVPRLQREDSGQKKKELPDPLAETPAAWPPPSYEVRARFQESGHWRLCDSACCSVERKCCINLSAYSRLSHNDVWLNSQQKTGQCL